MKDERKRPSPAAESTAEPETAVRRATDAFARLVDVGNVDRVYGKPIQKGDTTLIPAAEILAIGGFGVGAGSGSGPARGGAQRGGGGGGGGGGRTLARAVAVIVASPEGVRVQPIVDVTKIALAALTAAGFVFAAWSGMGKSKKFLRPFS